MDKLLATAISRTTTAISRTTTAISRTTTAISRTTTTGTARTTTGTAVATRPTAPASSSTTSAKRRPERLPRGGRGDRVGTPDQGGLALKWPGSHCWESVCHFSTFPQDLLDSVSTSRSQWDASLGGRRLRPVRYLCSGGSQQTTVMMGLCLTNDGALSRM